MSNIKLWSVHGDGKHVEPTAVVAPEERLAWPLTIGIGAQHVVAMFGATFLVPVLTGFPPTTTIFFSGVGTLVFIFATRGRGQRMGLPSYTGSSFAFISPVIAAKAGGISEALCGIFAAGLVLFVIGLVVDRFGAGWINALMPPAVTGAVVALIGLNLAPTAWASYQKQPWTATVTLVAIVLATVLFRGFWGRISILIGVIIGYLVAWPQGQLDTLSANLKAADWVGFPDFQAPSFSWKAISLIVPVVVVLIAENTGHIKAVASMTDRNLDRSLGRGYMGDGAATMLAGLGGGSGTTTYAENIGVMAATRIYSTAAYVVAGLTAILLGMVPKFGALIVSIPTGVLGGATIILYGLIAVLGGRIWVEGGVDFKNPVNLFPAAIGLILGSANATWTSKSGNVSFNGIAIGCFATIIIYQVMLYASRIGIFHGTSITAASLPADASPAAGHPPVSGTTTTQTTTTATPPTSKRPGAHSSGTRR